MHNHGQFPNAASIKGNHSEQKKKKKKNVDGEEDGGCSVGSVCGVFLYGEGGRFCWS